MKTWQIILLFALLGAIAAGTGYLVFKKPTEPDFPEPEGLEPVKAAKE